MKMYAYNPFVKSLARCLVTDDFYLELTNLHVCKLFDKLLLRECGAKAIMHSIPEEIVANSQDDDDWYIGLEEHNKALQWLKETDSKLRRGDIVWFKCLGEYRNEGKYIFDGQNLIDFAVDVDDYGTIPSDFCALDFHPRWWSEVVDHNDVIRFDPQMIADQLCIKNVSRRGDGWVFSFKYNRVRWHIFDTRSYHELLNCSGDCKHINCKRNAYFNTKENFLINIQETTHFEFSLEDIESYDSYHILLLCCH